jgi:hypothetical protein
VLAAALRNKLIIFITGSKAEGQQRAVKCPEDIFIPLSSNPLQVSAVPEFIYLVFAKTSPNRSFLMTENKHFGLFFAKTGSLNFGHRFFLQ